MQQDTNPETRRNTTSIPTWVVLHLNVYLTSCCIFIVPNLFPILYQSSHEGLGLSFIELAGIIFSRCFLGSLFVPLGVSTLRLKCLIPIKAASFVRLTKPRTLSAATLVWGILTLPLCFLKSFFPFLVLRGLSGIGMHSVFPSAVVLLVQLLEIFIWRQI
jgi:hypothetical protein